LIGSRTAVFATEQLGASSLDSATWMVYYVGSFSYDAENNRSGIYFHFDDSDNSRISGFSWTPPAAGGDPRVVGDGLMWLVICN